MSSDLSSDVLTHSESSINEDISNEQQIIRKLSVGKSWESWNKYGVVGVVSILVLISVCFFLLAVIFAILYFQQVKKGNERIPTDENYDSFSPILGGMRSYSFSHKNKEEVVEGVLFLPNNGEEFSYDDVKEDLSYAYFEVDLIEEQPQKWRCRGTCGERRLAVTLPTLTFYLFSVATAAAVSYYLSEIKRMDEDACGEELTVDGSSVKCELEGETGHSSDHYYKCGAITEVDMEVVDKVAVVTGLDFDYLQDEMDNLFCGDEATRDLATQTKFAKDCFAKIMKFKNAEMGSDIYKGYKFLGCKKHEGKFSESFGDEYEIQFRRSSSHNLLSCEECDLDPSL